VNARTSPQTLRPPRVAPGLPGLLGGLAACRADPVSDAGELLGCLLTRAQRAGAVRGDIDAADVKALITGCLTRTPGAADPPPATG
jgi:hypothetical protein